MDPRTYTLLAPHDADTVQEAGTSPQTVVDRDTGDVRTSGWFLRNVTCTAGSRGTPLLRRDGTTRLNQSDSVDLNKRTIRLDETRLAECQDEIAVKCVWHNEYVVGRGRVTLMTVVDGGSARPEQWTMSATPATEGLFGQKTITGERLRCRQPGVHRRRDLHPTWLPLILVLLGVAVLIYPVMATQHNNDEQQRLAEMYTASVDSAGPEAIAAKRASAQTFDDNLEGAPILDPWLESQRPDAPQYQAYLHEMDIDPVTARIVIPSIHVSLPVYHGTDSRTPADGVGHLFGTSLPIGGPSTHAVLTGHTGLSTATMLDNLTQVKKGDAFYVSSLGQTLKYEVVDIAVVIILTVVAGILGRLWWLRRCARLAASAERTEDSEDTEDSAGTDVSHDAQDADETDDVGGAEYWPGRCLKDMSGPNGPDGSVAPGERQDNPFSDLEPREP